MRSRRGPPRPRRDRWSFRRPLGSAGRAEQPRIASVAATSSARRRRRRSPRGAPPGTSRARTTQSGRARQTPGLRKYREPTSDLPCRVKRPRVGGTFGARRVASPGARPQTAGTAHRGRPATERGSACAARMCCVRRGGSSVRERLLRSEGARRSEPLHSKRSVSRVSGVPRAATRTLGERLPPPSAGSPRPSTTRQQ